MNPAVPPCPGPNALRDVAGTVRENACLVPASGANGSAVAYWRMRVEAPALAGAFAPGQFFNLRVGAGGSPRPGVPLLRRPFAPSEYLPDGFAFVYAVVGDGTRAMTALGAGDPVGVLAPLGRGFDLSAGGGAPAVVVGGGCGTPSLRPVAEALARAGRTVRIVAGAPRACAVLERAGLAATAPLTVATDDGSEGVKGTALDALDRLVADGSGGSGAGVDFSVRAGSADVPALFACGPHGMLRALAGWASKRGWSCQVSLEERMACGFGACVGCVAAVKDASAEGGRRYVRVCHDGPVFPADSLVW